MDDEQLNPSRDAWQRNETKITPQNAKDLQLLWKVKVPVKTMGMQSFREPLLVSGVTTAERGEEPSGDGWGIE